MSPATAETTMLLAAPTVSVDYPQEGEVVLWPLYAFRVTAPEDAESVELSINQGEWLACRRAVGYWWLDWSGFTPGRYEAVARVVAGGKASTSEPRLFAVA